VDGLKSGVPGPSLEVSTLFMRGRGEAMPKFWIELLFG